MKHNGLVLKIFLQIQDVQAARMKGNYQNAVSMAKHIAACAVESGDCVVDATVGNGHDTVLLAELVGETGNVYGFDIQEEAIKKTTRRLKEKNVSLKRITLIQDSHERLDAYVKTGIDFVMFNLGYLPGKNHEVTTKAETTVRAIKKSIQQLNPGGVITICVYPGHEEGDKERQMIENMMRTFDQKQLCASCLMFKNQVNSPPLLWILQKTIKNEK